MANDEGSWTPIFRTTDKGGWFGLVGGKTWAAARDDGSKATISEAPYAFLSILERDLVELSRMVEVGVERQNLSGSTIPKLPIAEIIIAGLSANSEYWQALALARLDQLSDKEPFRKALEQLKLDGASQSVRHRAKKMLKGF